MNALRRLLQAVALAGTLIVGTVAIALIVSQTPWFRDWLRRYIVRESKQYLNGELTIGRLGGNLFFGVQLSDVAVDVSGQRVVAVKEVEVDYSVFTIVSKGVVLDQIRLVEPQLRLEQAESGWNLGGLVKPQRKEADRKGPGRPIELQSIEISDGTLIVDQRSVNRFTIPNKISDLDLKAAFAYEPVHYSVSIAHASFKGQSPQFTLQQFKGQIAVRDDNLYLENVVVRTDGSAISVDGVIQDYLQTPVLQLTTTANVSLPEIAGVVPAVDGYRLRPAVHVTANGPAEHLALDFDVRSEAGNVSGQVTADVKRPALGVKGRVSAENLNLAPLLKDPEQRTNISGTATIDLTVAEGPADAPVFDRMAGTFQFDGPRAAALGYEATKVHARGGLSRGRVTLDARAAAYGGTATASGFIAPASGRRPLSFDLQGRAEDVNLKKLPPVTQAPALETDISVAQYHVTGTGRTIAATATLNQSIVEGATIGDGTVAEFTSTNGDIAYAARGSVDGLDLQRIGNGLKIEVLSQPEYQSQITGAFDVRGSGKTLERMTLDATGTLTDASIVDARLSNVAFETHLQNGALATTVKGAFEGLNPARLAKQERLEGSVTGSVDATFRIADLSAPMTPESIDANGRVTLEASRVGDVTIDSADVQGKYANRVGDITQLTFTGPDLAVKASGRLALDESTQSNLNYEIDFTDLAEVGRLAGQDGLSGSAAIEGTLTGNGTLLRTTGSLEGANISYQANNALDLDARYDVSVPHLTFADVTIKATTTANFVKAAGLELNLLQATTTYASKTLDFTTFMKERTRELEATGRVIFHPDHQEIHLPSLAVRAEGQEWRSAPGTEAAVQYGGGKLHVENLRLVNADQTLTVAGSVTTDGGDPSTALKVNANNVDLAQLEQLLLQNRGLAGRLNATASISGTTKAPLVDGHLEITTGAFQNYKYDSLVADVDFHGNRFDLNATLQQSPTEAITAQGTVPMSLFSRSGAGHVAPTSEDRIDLHIKSTELGLGFIQGLTSAVTNVQGTMQADVHVVGSGADPHVEGFVDIRNGVFSVPSGGSTFTGLDTRIDLEPDIIRIREFQIRDENGAPMTISGQLAVHERQVGAVDVSLKTANFEILDNELGDLGVDSDLKITGELRRPRVEGRVRIDSGRIEVDRVLQTFHSAYRVQALPPVVSAERTVEGAGSAEQATRQALARAEAQAAPPKAETRQEAEPAAPAGSAFDPVSMDVNLVIPDNLVLRGSNLRPTGPTGAAVGNMNITIGGNLFVRKAAGAPVVLTGVVNTVRGTYEFQGRRFEIVRDGTIRFDGNPTINPLLNVTARRLIPNTGVEARVRVTGTLNEPQLKLESTPPLEESDILALIVFNRPVNELGTGERASLATTAGGIATGFLAAPLGESIGRALDVDLFEITTTTDSGELGAGVTIGKQVGDRAFFKMQQQFGEESLSEFMLEYQLADFLRMQVTAAPETSGSANRLNQRRIERAGIDLIFFFSY